MVTDGQIPNPSQQLLDRIAAARGELGLEVHGLIVGDKTQVSRTACVLERSTCRTTGVVAEVAMGPCMLTAQTMLRVHRCTCLACVMTEYLVSLRR